LNKGTKILGTLVLALGAFSLYLAVANLVYWAGVVSMPLEGRLSSDLALPLLILSLLGLMIVNKRRRLEVAA
jgi:hypothetical protein